MSKDKIALARKALELVQRTGFDNVPTAKLQELVTMGEAGLASKEKAWTTPGTAQLVKLFRTELDKRTALQAEADAWEGDALPVLSTAELVKAVRKHATANYKSSGWDFVIECWSDEDIEREIAGSSTTKQAIEKVARIIKLTDEQRSEIQNA